MQFQGIPSCLRKRLLGRHLVSVERLPSSLPAVRLPHHSLPRRNLTANSWADPLPSFDAAARPTRRTLARPIPTADVYGDPFSGSWWAPSPP